MEIESPSFTEEDLRCFIAEVRDFEDGRPLDGLTVVERLEASLNRLEELVTFMAVLPPPEQLDSSVKEWTSREVLAHIVLFAQVIGWGMWAIASGDQDEIPLMSFLILRDVSGAKFARMAPDELLAIARTELTSSIEFLCMADASQMARIGKVGPFELTAAEIGEMLLCAHLEIHVAQLQGSLGACWNAAAPDAATP
jgi:hypothetical protein